MEGWDLMCDGWQELDRLPQYPVVESTTADTEIGLSRISEWKICESGKYHTSWKSIEEVQ